jgi:hypothetical protein
MKTFFILVKLVIQETALKVQYNTSFALLKGPSKNGVNCGKCKLWELVYAHKEHLETHKQFTQLPTHKIHYHFIFTYLRKMN